MTKNGILAFSLLAASACAGTGRSNAGDSFVVGASRAATTPESRLVVSVGGSRPATVEVPVSMLTARVKWGPIDGELEALVIPLGDVDVSAARFPPNGLQLREVTLDLPVTAHGTGQKLSDDSMKLDVVAPLRLMMGLGLDNGGTYDLGPTQTAPVHIHIEAGPTSVGVKASCSGVCWKVGGVAEMSDAVADIISPAEIID